MTGADAELRGQVARQLDELLTGPLATSGARAKVQVGRYVRSERPAPDWLRLWTRITEQYLARQVGVERDGRAALLTTGAPGAGKSTAVQQLGLVDDGWRRLDADLVKDYLLLDLVATGEVADVLGMQLADGRPVMPRELAGLVPAESVVILDRLGELCLRRGENVVLEGHLDLGAGRPALAEELARSGYREVSTVDVEVARDTALDRPSRGGGPAGLTLPASWAGGGSHARPSTGRIQARLSDAVCARPTPGRCSTRPSCGTCRWRGSPSWTTPARSRSSNPTSADPVWCNPQELYPSRTLDMR